MGAFRRKFRHGIPRRIALQALIPIMSNSRLEALPGAPEGPNGSGEQRAGHFEGSGGVARGNGQRGQGLQNGILGLLRRGHTNERRFRGGERC